MSIDTFAALRRHPNHSLADTATKHLENDLSQQDRDVLTNAAKKVSTHATVGSVVGLGLGLFAAIRLRQNRLALFKSFRAAEKPVQIVFEGGRTEPVPDLTPLLKPTPLGDIATYLFFSAGGIFVGGETGFLTGSYAGSKTITKDPETRQRVEEAFRRFRVDLVKQQLDELEKGSKTGLAGLGAGDVTEKTGMGGLW
ncbi:hypothetical protein EJ05DRAFT_477400 [Pseudovirgaria hyperparasitica]|uniref:Uncharacterized protein n=1 Tax=Pseudovirgaria hyperparasitica TaxID=470096 RepID=A0A6A6W570_9PEZI|nr:uncharacterized protein EJ05DRAFT_477400 [Pseudovirgaria hyperparasitica]KAF2757184.1 hypothetical protein EJ05DRAFT_477400 [Pseudovirgaria hyperparasitica]